jgi:hypothetical protein
MRLACTALFLDLFVSAVDLSSLPHTRQRVAFSLKRVPQVGQSFVTAVGVSGLIEAGLYHVKHGIIYPS